jgi:hypothetical protein
VVGQLLPMRHGLAAIREVEQGQPWLSSLLGEVAVGLLWAVAFWIVLHTRINRARAGGYESEV